MPRRKAFTLIELLVVIAVIAILTAILMPTLLRVRKQGRSVVCRSNLRQWTIILNAYTATHDGDLHNQGFCRIAAPEFWMYWIGKTAKSTERIRFCPMATKPADPTGRLNLDPGSIQATGGKTTAWGRFRPIIYGGHGGAPTQANRDFAGSYAMNSWASVPDDSGSFVIGIAVSRPRLTADDFWRTANIRGAERVPLFADSWWWCGWPKANDQPPRTQDDKTNAFPCGCKDSMKRYCVNRHDGFTNASMMDGSARRVGLKELWSLKWHRSFDTTGRWTKAGGVRPADWPHWMRSFREY